MEIGPHAHFAPSRLLSELENCQELLPCDALATLVVLADSFMEGHNVHVVR